MSAHGEVLQLPVSPFRPAPGASPIWRRIRAQALLELRMMLRQGEQVVLTLVLPVLLLVTFATVAPPELFAGGAAAIDVLTPGVLALAVLSTAFTGQAIGTGFDRRYGVLKRLGSTPLPRSGLLAGKFLAVVAVELLQICVLVTVALAMGWQPTLGLRGAGYVLALFLLATSAFTALGLLMAGTLRAEATLALANLAYLVLLVTGGVFVALDRFPPAVASVAQWNPLAALTEGARAVLQHGTTPGGSVFVVLLSWTVVCAALAVWRFRWE